MDFAALDLKVKGLERQRRFVQFTRHACTPGLVVPSAQNRPCVPDCALRIKIKGVSLTRVPRFLSEVLLSNDTKVPKRSGRPRKRRLRRSPARADRFSGASLLGPSGRFRTRFATLHSNRRNRLSAWPSASRRLRGLNKSQKQKSKGKGKAHIHPKSLTTGTLKVQPPERSVPLTLILTFL